MNKIFDNKIFQILIGIIKTIFIFLIVSYLLFIILQYATVNRSIFGYRLFSISTGSMSGAYEINDVIAVKEINVNKLKVKDDIVYKGDHSGFERALVTRRIIKIEKDEDGKRVFITKGLNVPTQDSPITEKQVLGKVIGTVPVITQINHIVKRQLGFFLFIFTPLFLIILLEILRTIYEIQSEKNKEKIEEANDIPVIIEVKEVESKTENKDKDEKFYIECSDEENKDNTNLEVEVKEEKSKDSEEEEEKKEEQDKDIEII